MTDDRLMNHKLHIILTFVTFGMWWPIYLGLYLYYKFSGSTIEKRRERRGINKELVKERKLVKSSKEFEKSESNIENWRELFEREQGKQRQASTSINQTPSLGYKKGTWNSSQAYTLACGRQISAKKQVGMFSKGLLNQTVRCEICNANRTVTGTLYPWDNK